MAEFAIADSNTLDTMYLSKTDPSSWSHKNGYYSLCREIRMKYDTTKTIANLEDGVKRQKLNYGTDRVGSGGREGEQEGNENTMHYLPEFLGKEIAAELISDIKRRALKPPSVWTHIVKYLDAVLNTPKEGFEDSLKQTMSDEPKFQLYCKKVLTDLIDAHSHAAKLARLHSQSGIVKVDANGIRIQDNQETWHLEVAGSPCIFSMKHANDNMKIHEPGTFNFNSCITRIPVGSHTIGEEIKRDRITLYSLNLMEGGKFLAEELESAKLPFSFSSRMRYMGILKMIARFHEEIIGKLEASLYVDTDESPKPGEQEGLSDHQGYFIVPHSELKLMLKPPPPLKYASGEQARRPAPSRVI
ncbi:5160_t:CDS:2 [Funneliformis mosseae]|uniref:5160_t:CDS:1 n=1 Tax=Funneliformis mosseae TaxID=27381 RepID=A0A9N8VRR6_FUNMO|nr:5160_t:CDS:2 [Funneliformis mosseae]